MDSQITLYFIFKYAVQITKYNVTAVATILYFKFKFKSMKLQTLNVFKDRFSNTVIKLNTIILERKYNKDNIMNENNLEKTVSYS